MTSFICPLASGSLGNSLLVATDRTRLLVDMGISRKRLAEGLKTAGLALEDVSAILLTHTHSDHISAAAVGFSLARKVPIYSTEENLRHLAAATPHFRKVAAAGLARPINGEVVTIGDVAVEAFEVPHDSPGSCLGFRLTTGPARRRRAVAVATDLGHMPAGCLDQVLDADAVVLESNHDPDLLRESSRPWDLIERIAGPHGHLSNETCAEAVAEIVGRSHPGKVRHVVLAHLSRDCNTPRLALAAQAHLARRRTHPVRLAAAAQYEPGPVINL